MTNKKSDEKTVDLKDWQFDQWHELYEKDPVLFEENRLRLFQQVIDQAPSNQQMRLKGLLFTMEGEKRRSRSVVSEQSRYLSLMMDQLTELNAQLLSVLDFNKPNLEAKDSTAKILSFKTDKK